MSDINISIVQGRLTHNPELRHTGSNTPVADLQIASNRFVPVKGGAPSEFTKYTTFVRVTLWNERAERWCDPKSKNFLRKGDMVIVEGMLFDDSYEKDGVKYNGRLKVDNVSNFNLVARAQPKPETVPSTSTPATDDNAPTA